MGLYSKKASEYFIEGYNCSQSVFLAFASLYGISDETAKKLASSFGGGMGRLREVCGAVTAMFAIAGLAEGYTNPTDNFSKAKHYKLIQKLAEEFKAKHETIICKDLLKVAGAQNPTPEVRNDEYYKARPCLKFVETAAEIIEKEILKEANV